MNAAGRVAIGVCTAYSPEMLRCCLPALASQAIPEGFEVTILIADNEPEPAIDSGPSHYGVQPGRRPRLPD